MSVRSLLLLATSALVLAAAALAFTGSASATVLCPQNQNPCEFEKASGTFISGSLKKETLLFFRTPYAEEGCFSGGAGGNTTNTGGSGEVVKGTFSLSFAICSCEMKVLKSGTSELQQIESTANGAITSSGLELTTACKVGSETVHCIYATENTKVGTLVGGNPAILQVSATIPTLSTGPLCGKSAELQAEYEITSPKPLYVEPAAEPVSAVLCTEAASPCSSHKPSGTVIKAELASKAEFQLIYGFGSREELNCAKSSLKAETTNTGSSTERIEGRLVGENHNVEFSFQECQRCEFGFCEKCATVVGIGPSTFTVGANESSGNGRISLNGVEITISCYELAQHCKFKTVETTVGKITGGSPARLDLEGILPSALPGTECGSGQVSGTYEITSPSPLYIEPG